MTHSADSERQFFDQVVAEQGDFNPFTDHGWAVLAQRFRELVAPPAGRHLDIGCGTGQSRRIYEGTFANYTGVDLSPVAIAAARAAHPNDEWVVADATQLPFPDSAFDVVTFSSVLHHIPDFSPAVREAFRVLRPGGRVFAYDPNVLHPAMALLRHPRSPLYLSAGVSPNERPLTPHALRRAFTEAGFVHIVQQGQSGLPYQHVAPRLLNAMLTVCNALDTAWQRVGLGHKFGMFVLTVATRPSVPKDAR